MVEVYNCVMCQSLSKHLENNNPNTVDRRFPIGKQTNCAVAGRTHNIVASLPMMILSSAVGAVHREVEDTCSTTWK